MTKPVRDRGLFVLEFILFESSFSSSSLQFILNFVKDTPLTMSFLHFRIICYSFFSFILLNPPNL